MLFRQLPLYWALGCSEVSPLRAAFQFTIALWVSWAWACWLSKLDVLGFHLLGAGLKVGVSDVGWKPCASQREAQIWEIPLALCAWPCMVWHWWRARISASSACSGGCFLTHPVCSSHWACFGFLSEEIVLYIAIGLVCLWEEVSSGSSYVATCNWNPLVLFLLNDLQFNEKSSLSIHPSWLLSSPFTEVSPNNF